MIDSYIDSLVNLQKMSHIMSDFLVNYARSRPHNINIMEIIILNLIVKMGGSLSPRDLRIMLDRMSSNNTYNTNSLIKKGLLVSKPGRDLGIDGRSCKLFITDSGMDLYKDVSKFVQGKFKEQIDGYDGFFNDLRKELVFLKENFPE